MKDIQPIKLTPKQQRYVDCYCGNIRESAEKAGVSYTYAKELHSKTYYLHVMVALKNRIDTTPNTQIMNRQQRQEFWSKIANDTNVDMNDRLKASELLARSEADFLERHEHTLKEYLFDENRDVSEQELLADLREFYIGNDN